MGMENIHHPAVLICGLVGSLLPDIDHQKSFLGRYNPFAKIMKHRGKTHTLLGCLLMSAPFWLISAQCFIFTMSGCLSHLIADKVYSMNPLKKRRKFKIKIW